MDYVTVVLRHDCDQLRAGQVFRMGANLLGAPSTAEVRICAPSNPGRYYWVPKTAVLPTSQLGSQCHMRRAFWFMETLRHGPSTERYLKDPRTGSLARRPYRFDSQGELLYLTRLFNIDRSKFKIGFTALAVNQKDNEKSNGKSNGNGTARRPHRRRIKRRWRYRGSKNELPRPHGVS